MLCARGGEPSADEKLLEHHTAQLLPKPGLQEQISMSGRFSFAIKPFVGWGTPEPHLAPRAADRDTSGAVPPMHARSPGPYRRTGRADRSGNLNTGISRSPPPDTRTSGSRETPARQSAATPDRCVCAPPARGTSRSDRAPVGAGLPARADAVDRWMMRSPPR